MDDGGPGPNPGEHPDLPPSDLPPSDLPPSDRPRGRRRRRWVRRIGLVLAVVLGVPLLAVTTINVVVTRAADGLGYDDPATVPIRAVAIVFGAKVQPDGTPSAALADRVRGGVELYRAGRVSHLLMTGDNSRPDYDEVTSMRDAAIAQGVPAAAITRDYAGFDTYDSCLRAARIFGVRDAVLVTQDYHLGRALFLCRNAGIDAVGLAIPDWQHLPERSPTVYPRDMAANYTVREWLARVKAFVESEVTHPEPTLGGPFEGLTET